MDLETLMERLFGAGDLRLTYGITVPAFIAIAMIVIFTVVGSWWLLAPTLLAVVVLTVVVAIGMSKMLDEQDDIKPLD